jgi:hypothetical protein
VFPLPDPRGVQVHKLLHKIVCALVDQPEFVIIKTLVEEDGAAFSIHTHPDDTGTLIGRQGVNARSIRVIVQGAGMKLGRRYVMNIHEESVEPRR